MVKLSERTLKRLGQHVTGDSELTPYRSGSRLVALFNEYGGDYVYPRNGGFPSRWDFAETSLRKLQGTAELGRLIEQIYDPLTFQQHACTTRAEAIDDINLYLVRDGLRIETSTKGAHLVSASGLAVKLDVPAAIRPASFEFIREHMEKCSAKLMAKDFSGAITNARSLCEQVLIDIERSYDMDVGGYDGDLPRLYKRVRKRLRLDPDMFAGNDSIVQLLRGLTSLVDGLAGMSNALGDRHGGSSKPKEHYAKLAVNAANTLCTFILESWRHQAPQTAEEHPPLPLV